MGDVTTASKQRSLGSTSSQSQQSKVVSSVIGESLESKLTLKDLEELMSAFIPDEEYGGNQIRLSRNQFSERLSKIVKKGSKEDYEELFDKIDITKEGVVDWDMFIQFMLLEFYEEDEKVKTTQVPQWKELKVIVSPHKDTIQRIELLRASNRYLSISKEGCFVFWDNHVKIQRSIKISTDTMKPRDIWVTDFVLLPNVNKIAVSFTSKEIAFYDLSSKLDFNCQYKLQGLKSTPLCMDYWTNPEDPNESVLVLGDVGGEVHALCFSSAQIALFDSQLIDELWWIQKARDINFERLIAAGYQPEPNCRKYLDTDSQIKRLVYHCNDRFLRDLSQNFHIE